MTVRQSVRTAAGSLASVAFKALVVVVVVLLFLDSGLEIDITTVALALGLLASPRILFAFAAEPVRRALGRRSVGEDRGPVASRASARPGATWRPARAGRSVAMAAPDDDRIASRAELLPEEQAVGSDDPEAQAAAILEESDERTETRDAAAEGRLVEHRTSAEVTDPPA